jgi:hypothetical protein
MELWENNLLNISLKHVVNVYLIELSLELVKLIPTIDMEFLK